MKKFFLVFAMFLMAGIFAFGTEKKEVPDDRLREYALNGFPFEYAYLHCRTSVKDMDKDVLIWLIENSREAYWKKSSCDKHFMIMPNSLQMEVCERSDAKEILFVLVCNHGILSEQVVNWLSNQVQQDTTVSGILRAYEEISSLTKKKPCFILRNEKGEIVSCLEYDGTVSVEQLVTKKQAALFHDLMGIPIEDGDWDWFLGN